MKTLNFNHLYYFTVIAREGSVSKACKKLFITQPTLSGQLRQLEDYFGKKLFDRRNRRLVLNKDGEIVLSYASQIFKLRDEMVSALKKGGHKSITKVRMGVLPSLSKSHVTEFARNLLSKPDFESKIVEGDMKSLVSQLKVGELDLILSDAMVSSGGHALRGQRVFSRDIVAVAGPKWKRFRKGFPESLDQKPFVNFTPHSRLRDEIDLYFASKHIHPMLVGEMDDVSLLRLAAEGGQCFAILPRNAAKEALSAGNLITLGTLKEVWSDLWVITKKGNKLQPVLKTTIDRFKGRLQARKNEKSRKARAR